MPPAERFTLSDEDPPHTPSPTCGCDLCEVALDATDDGELPHEFRWSPAGCDAVPVAPNATLRPPPSAFAALEARMLVAVQPPLPTGSRSPVCPCGAPREPIGTAINPRATVKWLCANCGAVEYVVTRRVA